MLLGKFLCSFPMIWLLVSHAEQQLPSYIVAQIMGGRVEVWHYLSFIFISFPNFKRFITFVVQTMAFQAKLPTHCVFQSHTVWLWKFSNCFKPALKNHIAKDFVIILSRISNKVANMYLVIFCKINTISITKVTLLKKRGSKIPIRRFKAKWN